MTPRVQWYELNGSGRLFFRVYWLAWNKIDLVLFFLKKGLFFRAA